MDFLSPIEQQILEEFQSRLNQCPSKSRTLQIRDTGTVEHSTHSYFHPNHHIPVYQNDQSNISEIYPIDEVQSIPKVQVPQDILIEANKKPFQQRYPKNYEIHRPQSQQLSRINNEMIPSGMEQFNHQTEPSNVHNQYPQRSTISNTHHYYIKEGRLTHQSSDRIDYRQNLSQSPGTLKNSFEQNQLQLIQRSTSENSQQPSTFLKSYFQDHSTQMQNSFPLCDESLIEQSQQHQQQCENDDSHVSHSFLHQQNRPPTQQSLNRIKQASHHSQYSQNSNSIPFVEANQQLKLNQNSEKSQQYLQQYQGHHQYNSVRKQDLTQLLKPQQDTLTKHLVSFGNQNENETQYEVPRSRLQVASIREFETILNDNKYEDMMANQRQLQVYESNDIPKKGRKTQLNEKKKKPVKGNFLTLSPKINHNYPLSSKVSRKQTVESIQEHKNKRTPSACSMRARSSCSSLPPKRQSSPKLSRKATVTSDIGNRKESIDKRIQRIEESNIPKEIMMKILVSHMRECPLFLEKIESTIKSLGILNNE